MSFDDDIGTMTIDVMGDLGTPAVVRHIDGRQVGVDAIIERQVQFIGEYNQTPEHRTIASLDSTIAQQVSVGAVLVVATGPYAGEYSMTKLDSDDAFVETYHLRVQACG